MTSEQDRPGGIVTWWWNLPLRRKGAVVHMLPLVVLLPFLAGVVWLNFDREELRLEGRRDSQLASHVQSVRQLFTDGETATRGYLVAGDETYVARFDDAASDVPALLEDMRNIGVDEFADELDEVEHDGRTLFEQLRALIVAGPTVEPAAVLAATSTMEDLRRELDDMLVDLEELQVGTRGAVDDRTRWIIRTLFGGMAVAAVGAFIGVIGFARSIATRVQRVSDAAARVLSGQEIGPVETAADDEIGRLVQQLNSAAEMLLDHNETLASSRDEAVAATRAKDEFLSRMSHELRTPLSAILGFGQLLQMEDLSTDDRDSVDHIVKAGRHLLDLINDLLDISRISTGHLALSLEPIDVEHLVGEVVALLRPQAAARDVAVECVVPSGVMVVADNQRLRQVVLNLLSNAIKYNREGGRVRFSTTSVGDVVRLAVTDTGRGLPAEGRERLFMPFERLDAAATNIEGTGVGLALSKHLIEAMDGTIGAGSEHGVGSTFWVELPAAPSATPVIDRPHQPTRVADAAAASASTVLYVEDNLANVRVMQRLMRDRPEHLEVVQQGGLALELARQLRPSLIFLDLHLPDLPGEVVLQMLLDDPDTAGIPVAILSADVTEGGTRRLLDLGAHVFMSKPIEVHEVIALLDAMTPDAART